MSIQNSKYPKISPIITIIPHSPKKQPTKLPSKGSKETLLEGYNKFQNLKEKIFKTYRQGLTTTSQFYSKLCAKTYNKLYGI